MIDMFGIPTLPFIAKGDLKKAQDRIPFLYYFLLLSAIMQLQQLQQTLPQVQNFTPRWPIFWAHYLGYQTSVELIYLLFVGTALTGAFYYRKRWARIVAFLGVFQFHALANSFGITYHQTDLWVWTALFFTILPDVWNIESPAAAAKETFLTIFWGAQAFVLLIYTMSGIWKSYEALQQLLSGVPSVFSFEAPALHVATQFIKQAGDGTSLFGPYIIEHPIVAWLPLITVLYLQTCAFYVAFKPNLHGLWAFGLVAFHTGVYLTLYVTLFEHIFLILLLLGDSPFRDTRASWRTAYDLPIFGPLLRLMISLSQRLRMAPHRTPSL